MQKAIQPWFSLHVGDAGRAAGRWVPSCQAGSSGSIPSRIQRSGKLVRNLRQLQVSPCSCSRCSSTSHPRFPHHFHLRQGCTLIRKSPRKVVNAIRCSNEVRRLISAPVCLIVSVIVSLTSAMASFRCAGYGCSSPRWMRASSRTQASTWGRDCGRAKAYGAS